MKHLKQWKSLLTMHGNHFRPFREVLPIYIPGRLRTASRPSSTEILLASYVSFFGITVLSSLMCYCLFLLKILLSVPFWGTVFYYIIFLPGIARFSLEERISSVHQLLKRSHVAVCFLLHLCAVSFPASVIHAHSRKSAHFGAADSR